MYKKVLDFLSPFTTYKFILRLQVTFLCFFAKDKQHFNSLFG